MPDEDEEWLAVVGYEGLYEVSSHGNVRSLDRTLTAPRGGEYVLVGRTLQPDYRNNKGHGRVTLYSAGSGTRLWIHRIVARSFLGEPPIEKPFVLHWDDNPKNNRVDNLRYGNTQDNTDDAIRNGTHPGSVTHCPKGHEYVSENLVGNRLGGRRCKTCELESDRMRHFDKIGKGVSDGDPRHGDYAGYRAGCRCDGCLLANRDYKREYARSWRARKRSSALMGD